MLLGKKLEAIGKESEKYQKMKEVADTEVENLIVTTKLKKQDRKFNY